MNNVVPLPIIRPNFDNANITNFGLWCLDNGIALSRYLARQNLALGLSPSDDRELDDWLKTQWDIEKGNWARGLIPHGEGCL